MIARIVSKASLERFVSIFLVFFSTVSCTVRTYGTPIFENKKHGRTYVHTVNVPYVHLKKKLISEYHSHTFLVLYEIHLVVILLVFSLIQHQMYLSHLHNDLPNYNL